MITAHAPGRGRTVLITGATSGIGKETALALAHAGFTTVIVGRREAATQEVAEWLRVQTGNIAIGHIVADLTSQTEVRRVAEEFRSTHGSLDVLVNNAGGVFPCWRLTSDGIEQTWALNHLAPMLLSLELLDMLQSSPPSRIVNVASGAHKNGRIDLGDQHAESAFTMNAYSNAKLANVMATYALARRLRGTGVTVNCLHPGVVGTSFGRNAGGWIGTLAALASPFLMTPQRGAATSVYLASAPDLELLSGYYFVKSRPRRSSAASYDEGIQERVWKRSLTELGITDPTSNHTVSSAKGASRIPPPVPPKVTNSSLASSDRSDRL